MQSVDKHFYLKGGNRLAEMHISKKLLEPVHYIVNIIKPLEIRPPQHHQCPNVKISTQLDVFSRFRYCYYVKRNHLHQTHVLSFNCIFVYGKKWICDLNSYKR